MPSPSWPPHPPRPYHPDAGGVGEGGAGEAAPLARGLEPAAALSDAELLAALLEEAGRRPDGARERAVSLLDRYGDLRGLAAAEADQLVAEQALSWRQARRVAAGLVLGRRAAALPLHRGDRLKGCGDIYAAYAPRLKDLKKEVLLAVHVDAKGRVQREERVSEGTLTGSPANPREVFGPALRQVAAGVILIHNHPSGDPEPSSLDVEVTRRMVSAGEILGVSLLDHIVIGADRYVSLLERGVIPPAG